MDDGRIFSIDHYSIKLIKIIMSTLDMILTYLYFYDIYISRFPKYKLLICHFYFGCHIPNWVPTWTYSTIIRYYSYNRVTFFLLFEWNNIHNSMISTQNMCNRRSVLVWRPACCNALRQIFGSRSVHSYT